MKSEQIQWTSTSGWDQISDSKLGATANLVFVFGGKSLLQEESNILSIKSKYPNAHIAICSTSGEIIDTEVYDDSIIVTAICFEKTTIQTSKVSLNKDLNSFEAGKMLASQLPEESLRHVFVLSDGISVNGTDLVAGLSSVLGSDVSVTGGLAGDATAFQSTSVGLNESPTSGNLIAIGLYGTSLKVGYASFGGWTSFGTERVVTKSEGNILYELDDKPALELYKTYLGKKAAELPASALLFPLSLSNDQAESGELVRTILSIDETTQSMTFAGDIPLGSIVKLMKSDHSSLIEGAESAAKKSLATLGKTPDLAILVSCVGRKLVLGQGVEEEIEVIRDILGDNTTITGFYSYGELAPANINQSCLLHNQTMTITLFSEA